jgi:hypothetical protein
MNPRNWIGVFFFPNPCPAARIKDTCNVVHRPAAMDEVEGPTVDTRDAPTGDCDLGVGPDGDMIPPGMRGSMLPPACMSLGR